MGESYQNILALDGSPEIHHDADGASGLRGVPIAAERHEPVCGVSVKAD